MLFLCSCNGGISKCNEMRVKCTMLIVYGILLKLTHVSIKCVFMIVFVRSHVCIIVHVLQIDALLIFKHW